MKKVVFVCLGNICRSPAAEGIMTELINKDGLYQKILIDSAGCAGYHVGELPDRRMRKAGKERGYSFDTLARKLVPDDLENFDYVVAMDDDNYRHILAMPGANAQKHKVFKMTDFCEKHTVSYVPDPYYDEMPMFHHVIDILEDATAGLLKRIKNELD